MLDAPKLASYLAAFFNAWALIEAHVADMIEYLVSEPHLKDGLRWLDPLGNAIYGDLKAFGVRLSLLRVVLKTRLGPQEYTNIRAEFDELYSRLSKASTRRNDYVHSIWGYTEEEPDYLVKSRPYSILEDATFRPPKFVGVQVLCARIKSFDKLAKDVREFDYKVRKREPKNSAPIRPDPEKAKRESRERHESHVAGILERLEGRRQDQQASDEPETSPSG